ncbi:hypothetical protein ACOMHN_026405 [Nucella lapillus]
MTPEVSFTALEPPATSPSPSGPRMCRPPLPDQGREASRQGRRLRATGRRRGQTTSPCTALPAGSTCISRVPTMVTVPELWMFEPRVICCFT